MSGRYYFDTCIWRDFYEDRFSKFGRPLGRYASRLFELMMKKKDLIFYSEFVISELKIHFNEEEINNMLNILFISGILRRVEVFKGDYLSAKKIGTKRNIPVGDVLHAILARKNGAILVSQDRHMQKLKDLVEFKRPEELI